MKPTKRNSNSFWSRKRYVWLPIVLLIYTIAMAWTFRETLTVYHDYWRYFGTIGMEVVVLVLLVIFLRWREKLRRQREDSEKE